MFEEALQTLGYNYTISNASLGLIRRRASPSVRVLDKWTDHRLRAVLVLPSRQLRTEGLVFPDTRRLRVRRGALTSTCELASTSPCFIIHTAPPKQRKAEAGQSSRNRKGRRRRRAGLTSVGNKRTEPAGEPTLRFWKASSALIAVSVSLTWYSVLLGLFLFFFPQQSP